MSYDKTIVLIIFHLITKHQHNIQNINKSIYSKQAMDPNKPHRLFLKNIKQLIQISSTKQPFKRMKQCQDIALKQQYGVIVSSQGLIIDIDDSVKLQEKYKNSHFDHVIDCGKYCVLPGFVDAHTHALFAGDRSKEYDMKLNGMNYVDIYNVGLGIRFSTQSVGKASVEELVGNLNRYLPRMSKLGTTTVQIKSGYGLNAENQVKMLKAIEIAKKKYEGQITIVSTFCGAHAIPKGKTQAQQTKDVIESQIPAVKKAMDQKSINPVFIDVFCEKNFFEAQSTIKILEEGKKIGLIPSFHGDELNNLQSGSIGAKVGARAISHLQYLSQDSIKLMSEHKIAGVMLPTTQNIQKLPIPPIKKMREHNMIVALGTDFCPNAFCFNMNLAAHYACTNYRMTPKQSIVAATLNSAYALNVQKQVGSIQVGKKGDFILVDAENWVYVVYSFGDSWVSKTIKNGVPL